MATKKIAYLHNHSVYSIQDSLATPLDYHKRIIEMRDKEDTDVVGFALTEHGVMYSYVKNYLENKDITNVIIGCEVYNCNDINTADDKERYHLLLLAKNQIGLKNLYLIASYAGLHKVKGKKKDFPRTDDNVLKRYGEGIIASSACIGGEICTLILNGQYDKAKSKALFYADIFDEFYLEVQPTDLPEQLICNDALVKMSQETGLPLVVTTDTHYIYKKDKVYHDILKKIDHLNPFSTDAYMQTYDEIYDYCIKHNIPTSCIENTVKIAEECKVDIKPKDKLGLFPKFPCPEGYDESTYLRKLAMDGLCKKIIDKKFTDILYRINRLNYELDVICSMGYAGYFLILWDWFKWCRENDILMGKGRGSGASSLVCYALDITTIDPIINKFIFERFLTRERTEEPDIDSDISAKDRPKGISYLKTKYGEDYVSQIITFNKYGLKNTFKAAMSAFVPDSFQEANEVTKIIPDKIGEKSTTYELLVDTYNNLDSNNDLGTREKGTIKKVYELLQEKFKKYPDVYLAVKHLAGCIKSVGMHAGGVVISSKVIKEHIPLIEGSSTAVLPLTQLEMDDVHFFNALKIDVLGLSALSQIHEAMQLIGLNYDWYDSEDFSDPNVYKMLREGYTTDVFQMSSFNATKMLRDMNVEDFEGLGVVNAGNRPGPLAKDKNTGKSMVEIYEERKKTGVVPSWGDKRVDEILKDTYGCIW